MVIVEIVRNEIRSIRSIRI